LVPDAKEEAGYHLDTLINKFGLIVVLSLAVVGCHMQYKGPRAVDLDGGSAKMKACRQFKEQLHQKRAAAQGQELDKETRTQPSNGLFSARS